MADTPQERVEQALELCRPGWNEHRKRVKRYDDSYNIYRASMPRPASLEKWQSQMRVPYGMQVLDTALVNIVSGRPRVLVRPRRPEYEAGAKGMQVIQDYYVTEDHLVEKEPLFVQQGLVYGVTAAKCHWLYKETTRQVKQFQTDPITGEQRPLVSKTNIILRDGPTFEPWNVYDAWWDPNARDVDAASYVVLRSWLTKDQLLANQFNSDSGEGIYHNLDALWETTARKPAQSAQESFLGGVQNRRKGMYEVLEVWTDDHLTVIGNQEVLLRDQDNPYWHGKKPIVIAQVRPDLFEMQGIPETELVDHLQQALWTVANMRMDNMHLTVMRGFTYREGGITDPNALQLKPRFKWGVMDHDDIRPVETQPLPPEAYREETELLSRMQLVTGINPYVTGTEAVGADQNTATGVTALQNVASRLLKFKADQIQTKGYARMYEQWGDMTQQFLDHAEAVKIVGPGGDEVWVEIGPQDVAGHFHYQLEGTDESLSKQQERGEAIALLNAFAPLIATGQINIKPVLERVASAYGFVNPESLLAAPQQPGQPAAPVAPGGVPQNGQGGAAQTLMGGQQLNPAIQAMIQNQGGGR